MRTSITVVALALAACGSGRVVHRAEEIPVVGVAGVSFEPLKRGEYHVRGQATGSATLVGVSEFRDEDGNVIANADQRDPVALAKELAVYRALQSIPGADVLLAPRFQVEITSTREQASVWTRQIHVTVRGRAIELAADFELAPGR